MKGDVVERGAWDDESYENGVEKRNEGAYIAHGVTFCLLVAWHRFSFLVVTRVWIAPNIKFKI